ncbi:formyltetrahydrofolate-dependent phosphoribosylglycinamide formyltransferase [Halothece sp. PCC 7418]|nr:phosphoribosylglycinamide formyltransferase [Halothece sp. PCC 7418]AFZ43240.1 formyltetrahydrofolate-dependent phosphoribosylglycinamide formyltransferase [Halothece sp. PCC 7418]
MTDSVIISPEGIDGQLSHPVSLAVMASGKGSNFVAIASAIAQGQLNAEIKVVIYNQPQAPVREKAEQFGVPAILCNHRDYPTREAFDQVLVETLKAQEVDWVIMAGWMRVVTPVLIKAFPDRLINIHPSLLPSFKGLNGVEQALAAGVKIAGCTVHLVRPEVDSGPILMQAAVPVLEEDTPETLHQRIQVQEHKILPRAIAIAADKEEKRRS